MGKPSKPTGKNRFVKDNAYNKPPKKKKTDPSIELAHLLEKEVRIEKEKKKTKK